MDRKHEGREDGTVCYGLPGFSKSARVIKLKCLQAAKRPKERSCISDTYRQVLENSSGKLQGREASAFRLACSRILPHPVTICQLPKSVETEDPGREWSADLGQREREMAPSVSSVRSFSHTLFAGTTARDLLGGRPAVPVPALNTQGPGCNMQLGLGPRPSLSFESEGRAKLAVANKAAGAHQELDWREPTRSRWPCRTEKPISEIDQHIPPQILHRCENCAIQGTFSCCLL